MPGGVATPLQSTGHRADPQAEMGHQRIEHTALAHTGRTAEHGQRGLLQPCAKGLHAKPGLTGEQQGLIAPAPQALLQLLLVLLIQKITLGEQQLHGETRSFSGEQETTGLVGIERRLIDSQGHNHQINIGHRWSCQPAAAGLNRCHNGPGLAGIDGFNPNPVTHMNGGPTVTETGAACAKQPCGTPPRRIIQLHLEVIGLQRHNRADPIAHNRSATTGDRQGHGSRLSGHHGDMMTRIAKTRNHHLLRLAPIELNLKLLPGLKRFQRQFAANEIHRAGGAAQIKARIAHPWPNSRENSPLLW